MTNKRKRTRVRFQNNLLERKKTMRIYNPFLKEYYDSKFSIDKIVQGCSKSTFSTVDEDVYFDLKKVVFEVKDEHVRPRNSPCFKRH